ncbi:transcriptional regulator [Celerinatantimonas sp. MCCC 1A17872]|uniref:winged helix-turn-helix domain-containing protein n=1 Tax=Celerinatantimonas sp. MCCC 1A17872 TaxID=3177514 RepID=UPI0038C54952
MIDFKRERIAVVFKDGLDYCTNFCELCKFYNDGIVIDDSSYLKGGNLFFNGERRSINKSYYRILCALVANVGNVVTREYLLKYGWLNQTNVINNVNVAISELRSSLRGTNMQIITIRKVGYLLVVQE